MNDALKIQISAFVDGELPQNESELLLRRLSQDAALRQQVAQYLEIGRLIRNDRQVSGMDELRGRIAAALGDDISVDKADDDIVGSRLMTPATGVAVAATVAALALVGLGQLNAPAGPDFNDASVAIDSAPTYTEPSVEDALRDSPQDEILEYYRLHDNNFDELQRFVNFELSDDIVEIEPHPHLRQSDDAENPDVHNEAPAQE